jgi:pimeloyl-ACP methyl ester carboxylesterase
VSDRIGRFRTPEHATRFYALYDDIVARRWPTPYESLDVPSRFGPTHVRRTGPAGGTPVVLIHPTVGSSAGWYPLIAPLCERHPVYTPDTIGTPGRSVQTAPIRSVDDLVVWLDEVLDALDLDAVHLVGYSEGGWIAGMHAALSGRRDRLRTLTLIEPGGAIERIPRPFLAAMILRAARALAARDKHRALRDFNQWMNGDVELTDEQIDLLLCAMKGFRQKLPTPDRLADDQLRRITTPTLLMMAADTKLYDPDQVAARARALLADVQIDITPNAGHGLAFQHPAQVIGRILAFIETDHERSVPTPPM